jgi:hypothetical protein
VNFSTIATNGDSAVTIAAPILLKTFPDITGISSGVVGSAYRNLRENEFFAKGSGPKPTELNSADAVLLLLASIAPGPAHMSAKLASLYGGLRDAEGYRALDGIAQIIDSFDPRNIEDERLIGFAYHSYVVVDLESPRVTIVRECNDGSTIEQVFGEKEPKAFEARVSTSKRIPGKVLFEISVLLNKDYWDAKEKRAA